MIQQTTLFIMLLICAIQDIKTKEVKLLILCIFAIIGVFMHLVMTGLTILDILGGMAVGLCLILLSLCFKNSVGIGDGVVLMVAGIFLGTNKTVALFIYSILLSGIFALYLIIFHKKEKGYEIPFVPFLMLGYMGVILL